MLAESPADVVVSDMRMPHMNGAQLLNEVMLRHPRTVRFILSGFSDLEMIMQCIGGTHQFLDQALQQRNLAQRCRPRAGNGRLGEQRRTSRRWSSSMSSLPSMPVDLFRHPEGARISRHHLEQIGATIARDAGMTAKMLQLVNSAFFGLQRISPSDVEAVMQLGLETIKSLVLGIHVFSEFENSR
jgi:response regulator RpfG family c-di-GMP phosphodiesterase